MGAQRTKLKLGGIDVDISLVKACSPPSAARWDTWMVDEEGKLVDESKSEPSEPKGEDSSEGGTLYSSLGQPAPTKYRRARGVILDDGTRIDLTEELKRIDEYVKIDGIQVIGSIPLYAIPRSRILETSYAVPQNPLSQKALGILYGALTRASKALLVRYTKRTNQALGILAPAGYGGCIVLTEIAFASHLHWPPASANVADTKFSRQEMDAAMDYIFARVVPLKEGLDEVDDERRILQAELLKNTREGAAFKAPTERPEEQSELAELLLNAA